VNCCVASAAKVAGLGVTAIEVMVAAVTVRAAVPLTPESDAVIVVEPLATPVARPAEVIVATEVFEDVQVAVDVTLPVLPLL
jgi:hypothetical protein